MRQIPRLVLVLFALALLLACGRLAIEVMQYGKLTRDPCPEPTVQEP